jgi:hypothetical protein
VAAIHVTGDQISTSHVYIHTPAGSLATLSTLRFPGKWQLGKPFLGQTSVNSNRVSICTTRCTCSVPVSWRSCCQVVCLLPCAAAYASGRQRQAPAVYSNRAASAPHNPRRPSPYRNKDSDFSGALAEREDRFINSTGTHNTLRT